MSPPNIGRPIEILLAEDNPGDVRLTQEALRDANVLHHLHIAKDGVEALAFLSRVEAYLAEPRPDIILLDLKLPRKDGWAVLAVIKADRDLRRIPVVILTTSQDEQDVLKAYNLLANCYVVKPVDPERFITIVQSLENFWFQIVKLPREGT